MQQHKILYAVIIVLIIIVVFITRRRNMMYNEYMIGVWQVDEDYARDSGLDDMVMYINSEHTGYLVIMNNGGKEVDDGVGEIISKFDFNPLPLWGKTRINLKNNNNNSDLYELWEVDYIIIDIDIPMGVMKICSRDQILAVLVKNNSLSEVLFDIDM